MVEKKQIGTRGQLNPAKRTQIMGAAVDAFLELGFNAARMDAIGNAAGVSFATLYKHFPSKEALFEAVIDYVLDELYAKWKDQPPPDDVREGLTAIAQAFLSVAVDPRLLDITRVVIAQARVFPHLGHKLMIDVRVKYTARTDAWLMERVRRGDLDIPDIERARQEFLAVLADAFFWPRMFMVEAALSRKKKQEVIASAVDLFMARYAVTDAAGTRSKAPNGRASPAGQRKTSSRQR
jgi:TetR/AcrR family transcriptional regulator of autoinduction and epiphytic fitness